MSSITTHILDLSLGRPAPDVHVTLEVRDALATDREKWDLVGCGETDTDGRLKTLVPAGISLSTGIYRLTFDTGAYFAANNIETFYPSVTVAFSVGDVSAHYHVPLLLSPFGYSTYRGS